MTQATSMFLRDRGKKVLAGCLGVKLGILRQYEPRPIRLGTSYSAIPDSRKSPISRSPVTFSIVTPSYNQGQYLERTILSVLQQGYPHLEYIVQDGGSRDGSLTILQSFQNRLHHWESAPDRGQTQAINLGFRHGAGEVLAYLNSDDLLLPGTLHYVADYFNRHPHVDVVYGHRIVIDEHDREVGRWILPAHDSEVLSWADFIPQETLFWRRSIWEKIGAKLDESFQFAMDWDLLLRFRDVGARFVRLPRFLGAFRVHTEQKTCAQLSQVGMSEMQRLCDRCQGRAVAQEERAANILTYLCRHALYHRLFQIGLLRY